MTKNQPIQKTDDKESTNTKDSEESEMKSGGKGKMHGEEMRKSDQKGRGNEDMESGGEGRSGLYETEKKKKANGRDGKY